MIRRLKTREELDSKRKRNQIIIGVVLVGLMILSTAGYAILQNGSTNNNQVLDYNGLKFIQTSQGWQLTVQTQTSAKTQTFYFQNLPNETQNISVIGNFNLNNFAGKPLYFVNNTGGGQEILINLGRYIQRYQDACLSNSTGCETLPIKTCKDNVVVFVGGNGGVKQVENCTYISGDIKASDAFVYKVLGIS
jgi:hypothetical protein